MTITVRLDNIKASTVMDIVHELRREGHIQGEDFDFAYNPNYSDGFSEYDSNKKSYAEFMFHTEESAFFFKLKYEGSK
jgi:hypothetical protein